MDMHPTDSQFLISHVYAEYQKASEHLSLDGFLEFAHKYLDENRTVETFPVDANCGIRLSNNKRCLIHPPTQAGDGSMQDSGSVGVTEGLTQPGQEGVTEAGDQKVI